MVGRLVLVLLLWFGLYLVLYVLFGSVCVEMVVLLLRCLV